MATAADLRDVVMPQGWAAYDAAPSQFLPSYVNAFTLDAGLPDLRLRSSREQSEALRELPFASAVVETFDPSKLRPFLSPAEWEIVRVIVEPEAFAAAVPLPDANSEPAPAPLEPRLTPAQVRDLMTQGYIRPLSPELQALYILCPCSIFAVIKADLSTLRLIWNGVNFNRRCQRPPRFRITPLSEMVSRLLKPGVVAFLAFDFRTWFVQLRLHPLISAHFRTIIDGELYEIAGVPMGWAWACVIAHSLTIAFTRAVIAELGAAADGIVAVEHCIDNTIFALSDSLSPEQAYAAVTRVATRLGVTLKESATEMGATVDWMLYRLNADKSIATFKDDYIKRLSALARRARRGGDTRIAELWHCIGLAVFTLYAAQAPMTPAAPLWAWLAAHVPPAGVHGRTWGAQHVAGFPHWRLLCDIASAARDAVIRPLPWVRALPTDAPWGVTDAAGSGMNALLLCTPHERRLVVYRCAATRIDQKELCALVTTAERAVADRRAAGGTPAEPELLTLWTDNEVARAAMARGWATWPHARLATRLEAVMRDAQDVGLLIVVMRVGTEACLADAWTRRDANGKPTEEGSRVVPRPACVHRPTYGRICPCDVQWARDCGVRTECFEEHRRAPPALPALPVAVVRTALY